LVASFGANSVFGLTTVSNMAIIDNSGVSNIIMCAGGSSGAAGTTL